MDFDSAFAVDVSGAACLGACAAADFCAAGALPGAWDAAAAGAFGGICAIVGDGAISGTGSAISSGSAIGCGRKIRSTGKPRERNCFKEHGQIYRENTCKAYPNETYLLKWCI